jgi:phosphoglycolate phosphatase
MTAWIFDLDGTLIDSRLDIAAACNHTLEWAGRAPLPAETVAGFVGDGARTLLARTFDKAQVDEELAEFVRFYAAHPATHTKWMPGAREALDKLRPCAIVTNKPRVVTERVLAALDVRVTCLVAGGDAPLKPDPAPILLAMKQLSSSPADTFVVGDGVQDILAGTRAGCPTIAVLGGFHSEASLRAAHPTRVIHSLAELL